MVQYVRTHSQGMKWYLMTDSWGRLTHRPLKVCHCCYHACDDSDDNILAVHFMCMADSRHAWKASQKSTVHAWNFSQVSFGDFWVCVKMLDYFLHQDHAESEPNSSLVGESPRPWENLPSSPHLITGEKYIGSLPLPHEPQPPRQLLSLGKSYAAHAVSHAVSVNCMLIDGPMQSPLWWCGSMQLVNV